MVFSIQLAIFLFIEILRFNCEIYNLLSENIKRPCYEGFYIFSSRITNFAVTIRGIDV